MKKSWTKDSHSILEQATGLIRYNRWIFSLCRQYLGQNILEIGSGLGGLSINLPKERTTLSDNQDFYVNYLKHKKGFRTIKLDVIKPVAANVKNSFDTIISSNVFEHLENDDIAFTNCTKILKGGGKLILFLPARPEIYGSLDAGAGHFRRYTKEELSRKVKMAGFKIIKIKYVNFVGYFTWWLRGKLNMKLSNDNKLVILFDHFVVPLLYLEKYLETPFGQSLFLVAEKL